MREFTNNNALYQVWYDDCPIGRFSYTKAVERKVEIRGCGIETTRSVKACVENSVNVGTRLLYSFIGGEFEPTIEGNQVEISVNYVDELVEVADHTLAKRAGMSYLGLTESDASVIADCIAELLLKNGMQSIPGKLIIDTAITSEVGSSSYEFSKLARYFYSVIFSLVARRELPNPFSES